MADLTRREVDLINEDRREQAAFMRERLEKMGITVNIMHYTGDSSYPTEYTIAHGTIRAGGPTLDIALAEFVEKLLLSEKADAYRAMETALRLLSGDILNLRTDVLVIKALIAKESE